MLKQRIATALVLVLVLFPALFYPDPRVFCAVVLVMLGAGGWEWSRLNGGSAATNWLAGKTWEGVWGGMAGVLLLAAAWIAVDAWNGAVGPSLYSELARRGTLFVVVAVLFLACMSVVGDLVESLIKRSAGVKDSSGLLPGHGGVLDRLDALLPSLPLAMMIHSLGNL